MAWCGRWRGSISPGTPARWHEVARFPNRFQNKCVGETTAEYEFLPNGQVRVTNACRQATAP